MTRSAATVCAVAAIMMTVTGRANAYDPAAYAQLFDTRSCIGCDLREADFFGRDLSRMVLSGADLRGADMTGALVYFSILQGADLRGALLDDADLYGADLFRARMSGVSLDGARVCHTVLPNGQRSYDACTGTAGGY